MQDKLPLWRRSLKAVLLTLVTIVLLAAFYLAVVMGTPQEEGSAVTARQDQPLLTALPAAVFITDAAQLDQLLDAFPAPVLASMNAAALRFDSGLCEDIPYENGLGRKVTLTYRTAEDALVTLVSIYPARATSLITKGDYVLSDTFGLPLAGLRSVRMEKPGSICMHAQGAEALYVVTLPELSASALRALTTTFQLYQGD